MISSCFCQCVSKIRCTEADGVLCPLFPEFGSRIRRELDKDDL